MVGWAGASLILAAYILVTLGRLTGRSPLFQWMNLVGAAGFVVNGWWHGALPSATLNIVWALFAAGTLWTLWKSKRLVDLSHVIEHGMITYEGLPGPHICDFWTREGSAAHYDDGSSFQIGRIDMVANTGTYLDAPFHRYADGADLAGLDAGAARRAPRPPRPRRGAGGRRRRLRGPRRRRQGGAGPHRLGPALAHRRLCARPSLPHRSRRPAAGRSAARPWSASTATISTTRAGARRPVHTILLGADIPICEHMTNLGALPADGLRLHRRAAEDRRHGHLSGARLRRDRLSNHAFLNDAQRRIQNARQFQCRNDRLPPGRRLCHAPFLYRFACHRRAASPLAAAQPPNPQIDYPAYARLAQEVRDYRAARLIDWRTFLAAAAQSDVLILDARSERQFAAGHLAGAINVPLPEFSEERLAEVIGRTDRPILIYCNNNFRNDRPPVILKSGRSRSTSRPSSTSSPTAIATSASSTT